MFCQYTIGAIIQLLWPLQWRKILWVWRSENIEAHGCQWWRNASCSLNLISKFLLLSQGRYLCLWTICPRVYHAPSSQCLFNLSLMWTRSYIIYFENQVEQSLLYTVDSKDGINLPRLKERNERTIILRGNNSTWFTPSRPFPIHVLRLFIPFCDIRYHLSV